MHPVMSLAKVTAKCTNVSGTLVSTLHMVGIHARNSTTHNASHSSDCRPFGAKGGPTYALHVIV